MKKRRVLKGWVDNSLIGLVGILTMLIAITIDNIGKGGYNIFLTISIVTIVLSTKVLIKYSRNF